MLNIQSIWLFFFLLPYWVVVSYCLDCKDSAFMVSKVLTSPALTGYGMNNLNYSNAKPWVGNTSCDDLGTVSDDVYIEFNFNHEVQLENIVMAGGNVMVGSEYKDCFVKRFVLEYKNSSSNNWIKLTMVNNNKKYNKKFDSYVTGYHNHSVGINGPVTALKIIIKKCEGYPAVKLSLRVCGVCNDLPRKDKQTLQCNNYKSNCTYSCVSGYKQKSPEMDGVKTCSALDNKWSGQNLICVDINECKMNTAICGQHGYCTNADGNYACVCYRGYTWDGTTCVDINECVQKSGHCDDNAICNNTFGSYDCTCKKGFTGDGNACKDIIECGTSANCHPNATCKDIPGSYKCVCKQGFTGGGQNCTDINECREEDNHCDDNAWCTNTVGSHICTCKKGFTRDGNGRCTDINECEMSANCHPNATCKNIPGSYNCTCDRGFSGNGTMCDDVRVKIEEHSLRQEKRFDAKLELYCSATGDPRPRITWQYPRDGKGHNRSEGRTSYLTISNVVMNDSGTYICIADNGETQDQKKIIVTVDGKPDSPKVLLTSITETSILVSWSTPNTGASPIKNYTINYEKDSKTISAKINNLSRTYQLINLKPDTTYPVWVVAFNNEGPSEPQDETFTTLAPKPSKPSIPLEGPGSLNTVKIRLIKMKTTYNTLIQIIVGMPSSRRKREVRGKIPKNIKNYEDAIADKEPYYITAELENKDNEFVVGDGNTYGFYQNKELQPGTAYEIYQRGVSFNSKNKPNYGELSDPLKVSTKAVAGNVSDGGGKSMVGIAVGLAVTAVVVVILVVLLLLYLRARQPKTLEIDPETGKEKKRKRSLNSELLPLTKKVAGKRKSSTVEDGSPDPNHPPVPTSAFAKHVGKLHKSDDRGFMIQYNTLEACPTHPSEAASLAENKEKNRYANIIAYDVSQVHLRKVEEGETDYINASHIDGYNSPNAYIATQGPLTQTFNDFWQMVWEQNCSSIIMLTNLQERHKIKCHKYWPEESEKYGDITVTATRREQYADYVIRSFHMKMDETEEEREIKQFHFTVWPDHGVPEYPTAILAFQRRVRAYSTRESGPLVVHCSAGVGRSGTFIVIDSMLAGIQNEQTIDIYNYVRYLRSRRMFMVQTEEQYIFCHDALLESILCGNTQIAAHNLRIEMNKLRETDPATKMNGFEIEFKTLKKVSPSLPKECFVVASYPDNMSKNRYETILASDHGRVTWGSTDEKEDSPYINAVFVDGYKQQNAFILTQAPLPDTIKVFWRMLFEKRSACVVLLCDLAEEDGDFPQFWPKDGTEEYDVIKVELASDAVRSDNSSEDKFQEDRQSNDLVVRKLKLIKDEDKPLVVKMFQHLSWKETSVPSDISEMVSLIQRIEKWQQHSGNGPITVVCNDGLGRSGTFAALCSVLERVKTEQVVDVFQTIKALRIQRPGLVKDVDQYQFIHLGVQEYLDSFSDYANFK